MAIIANYNLKIYYNSERFNLKNQYKDILSNEQLSGIDTSIEKDFPIEQAYHKIDTLNGSKDNIEIRVGIYKNELKEMQIATRVYSFAPNLVDSANFIKQGYEYLKTLPEYANAIDC